MPTLASDNPGDQLVNNRLDGWMTCLYDAFALHEVILEGSTPEISASQSLLDCTDAEDLLIDAFKIAYDDKRAKATIAKFNSSMKLDVIRGLVEKGYEFKQEHAQDTPPQRGFFDQYQEELTDRIASSSDATDELLSLYRDANRQCSGVGDSLKTWVGCSMRDIYSAALSNRDMCYGKEGQAGYEMKWHKCGSDSLRP